MEAFLVELFSGMFEEEGYDNDMKKGLHTLDRSTVQLLLKSMDTAFDKNVLRSVLALSHSRPELYDLGIDASAAKQRINKIIEVVKECENALIAGEDLVRIHLLEKQDKLQREMVEASNTLEKKRNVWPEKRVEDLEDSIISIREKLNDVGSQLSSEDTSANEKTRRAAKRRAESLLNESRIKRRKLGAGRPGEIDEDEERFLLKAIEDMSTAHGRRHDTVMYLHHRVKAKDMLKIVNYRRATKWKRPLKAVSTVLARGTPKRIHSIQAKRPLGQSLFCCKKPPKTEDNETELTHHQRAHVKNVIEDFCYNEEDRKYAFIKSMDDKAYVRPGTSVGLRDVKRAGIYQPSDSDAARKLPKYDWVNEEVYVTHSTHQIFTKKPEKVGSKEAYVMTEDESFVIMRPKAHVGSSGTVWSSEDYELRANRPDLHDVSESSSDYTILFRSYCTRIKDKVKHFIESTTKADVDTSPFQIYEEKRLTHTSDYLEKAVDMVNITKMTAGEGQLCGRVQKMVQSVLFSTNNLAKSANTGVHLWNEYQIVIKECDSILQLFEDLKLPKAKPRVLELTDAGPGV